MADRQPGNGDIAAMTFEAALAELERIVDELEKGDIPLDKSIEAYERGEALKAHCAELLKNADERVRKITLSRDGRPTGTEPLDQD